jgi:hypothetical protein
MKKKYFPQMIADWFNQCELTLKIRVNQQEKREYFPQIFAEKVADDRRLV